MPIDKQILKRLRANEISLISLNLNECSLTDADIQDLVNVLEKNTALTALWLENSQITDEGAQLLAQNTTLKSLYLWNNEIGNLGGQALAKNTTLTTLNLESNQIADEGAQALAKNTTLESLYLWDNEIGRVGGQALADNKTLTALYLGNNQIGDEGAKALARNTNLITLNLARNQIGDEGAQALAKNTTLTALWLENNQITDEGVQLLAQNTTLKSLYLWNNEIGNLGGQALAKNTTLTTLNLESNQIADEGAQALAKNTTLESLYLWDNEIGRVGGQALADNKTLTALYLGNNQIGGEGAKALARNTNLTTLNLDSNQIGDEGAQALAKNTTLTALWLENNQITDEGAQALAENEGLSNLYLKNNQITDEGAQALVRSSSLIDLDLGDNPLGEAVQKAVNEMLAGNKKARDVLLNMVCVGDFEQVQERVLNKKQSVHTRNDKNRTLLHFAAQKGHAKLVSWLCEQGARIDLRDDKGNTPMQLAIKSKRYEVVCDLMHKELTQERQQREATEKELEVKKSELVQEHQQRAEKERELAATKKELAKTKSKLEVSVSALLPVIPSSKIEKEWDSFAEGHFGEVYRGQWLGVTIAVKELVRVRFSEEAITEFREEAHKMARLRSPYVVTIYGITLNAQGRPKGIVMEYMPQGSLDTILYDRTIKLSWLLRHKMMLAVAQGLSFLHQQDIIHNDLKSPNVLVRHRDDEWELKLTDFGLSKIKQEIARFTNTIKGTPAWMAPELFDKKSCSKASDVYAYGIVLWEIVSRKPPFDGLSLIQIVTKVFVKKERPPIAPEAPSLLVSLMQLCWKQNKKDRLPTEAVITKLEALPLKQELRDFDNRDAGEEIPNRNTTPFGLWG